MLPIVSRRIIILTKNYNRDSRCVEETAQLETSRGFFVFHLNRNLKSIEWNRTSDYFVTKCLLSYNVTLRRLLVTGVNTYKG